MAIGDFGNGDMARTEMDLLAAYLWRRLYTVCEQQG
jgi:hypothetical protein